LFARIWIEFEYVILSEKCEAHINKEFKKADMIEAK
jgi:hypothetical protein